MKKNFSSATISIGIICLIMAFLVTVQIKSVIHTRTTNPNVILRVDELLKQLNEVRAKNEKLNELVTNLQADMESFEKEAAENSDYSKTLLAKLERAEIMAGLVEVQGSGLTITVKDSTQKNTVGDPRAYVIHDSDLLSLINELCDAGAEAISLNDERIISTTEIRCAGATVSINNTRLAQPFTIKAIGDPVNLENALLMRNGVYDTLTAWGLEIDIKKSNSITVPAYTGNIIYKYAVPVNNKTEE